MPLLVVAAPLLVGIVALLLDGSGEVHAGGDASLLELATREALAGRRLLGPWSRFGWNHPGPAYFYVLALPYRLVDGLAGLRVGALLVNAGAAVAVVAVVGRLAGGRGAWGAGLTILALIVAVGPAWLADPWNPYVVVVPGVLFTVLCAAGVAGSGGAVVAAALVGSFVVQTNVATAPYVGVLLAGAVAAVVWRRRQRSAGPADGTAPAGTFPSGQARTSAVAVVCLAALALLWAPPLVEQVWADGNAVRLARFVAADRDGHSLGEAALAYTVGASALPLGKPAADLPPVIPAAPIAVVVVSVAAGVAGLVVGVRRRDAAVTALSATGLLAGAVCVVSATRVAGPFLGYLVFWMVAAPTAVWLALAVAAAQRWPRSVAAVTAALAVTAGVGFVRVPPAAAASHPASAAAAPAVVAYAREHCAATVRLRIAGRGQWPITAAIAVALDRAGRTVTVDSQHVDMYGEHRRSTGGEDLSIVVTAASGPAARPAASELVIRTAATAVYGHAGHP